MPEIWNSFRNAIHLGVSSIRPSTNPDTTSATSRRGGNDAEDTTHQARPARPTRDSRSTKFRLLSLLKKKPKQDAPAARLSSLAPSTNLQPVPDKSTVSNSANAPVTPANTKSLEGASTHKPLTIDDRMVSIRNVLNTIQETDWEAIFQSIEEAIRSGQLGKMSSLLYGTLRKLPLPAKSMLEIAKQYPQERDNPAFKKVCQIASGLDTASIPSEPAMDPVFNPAALLASYYRTRSDAANAAYTESANQSGRLREPNSGSEPAGDDSNLRKLNDVNTKWMLIYDLKAAIEASLEKTKVLSDAIEAYERSRRGS